jgi:parallel beta-helix repeat protein
MLRSSFAAFAALIVFFSISSFAQGVSGAITADTTWSSATPVVVSGTVTVPAGITLTIQAGAVVQFASDAELIVVGKLIASGTSANHIVLTSSLGSPAPGSWVGLHFQNTANVGSTVQYCEVLYAGGGTNNAAIFYKTGAYGIPLSNLLVSFSSGNGVNTRASTMPISNSAFVSNAGYGIYSDLLSNSTIDSCTVVKNTIGGVRIAVNSTPVITNSRIDSNGIGIYIENGAAPTVRNNLIRYNTTGIQFMGRGSVQPTITNNTIAYNSVWGFLNSSTTSVIARYNYWGAELGPYNIGLNPTGPGNPVSDYVDFVPWLQGGAALPVTQITATISTNTVWSSGVYWVKNSISVNSGITLTIKPGVIIKLANGVYFRSYGVIDAQGKPDSLIIFTSDKDDSYGGDSNGDGQATVPDRGNWDRIWIDGSGSTASVFKYCLYKYGGSGSYGNMWSYYSTGRFENCYFTLSSSSGYQSYNSNPILLNSTFSGNGEHGIYIYNGSISVTGCSLSDNLKWGIRGEGNAQVTIRTSNILRNQWTGIAIDGGGSRANLVLLDSSVISFNKGAGAYAWYGSGYQQITNNRFEGNSAEGFYCFNIDSTILISNNTIINNTSDGIVTSKASMVNNVIQGNRYPIALLGNVSSSYSGNTLTGNQFNNAIGLRTDRWEEAFRDTLKFSFPASITSNTYVVSQMGGGYFVNNGTTLVIEPGVILKFAQSITARIEGKLIAVGTPSQKIVFTSWRDAVYGGKTNLASDNNGPAPGNWNYVWIRYGGAVGSKLQYCTFRYGGGGGDAILAFEWCGVMDNVQSDLTFFKSSTYGIRIYRTTLSLQNIAIDSSGWSGMYAHGYSDVSVQNGVITNNNGNGLGCEDYSSYRLVANCTITRNSSYGIYIDNGQTQQAFSGNVISFNGIGGIWNRSDIRFVNEVRYFGNSVTDHPADGIVSTRATFIDNTISRNRYPIGVAGRTGNIYVDGAGVDGNIFSGNVYNSAISIRSGSLSDTLKATFPKAFTSKVYVALEDIGVYSPLFIEPGVIVKFQPYVYSSHHYMRVEAPVTAIGTPQKPIIFTSWRDTVGGKTTAQGDNAAPLAGDWRHMFIYYGAPAGSVFRNVEFRYGGRDGMLINYFYANGVTLNHVGVKNSYGFGIEMYQSAAAFDTVTVDSSNFSGVHLTNSALNTASFNGCIIKNNKDYGIFAEGSSKITSVTNCVVSNNAKTGIVIQGNTIPLSVIGNTVGGNSDHGIYITAENNAVDSLLFIAGNAVTNNGRVGIFSSRAHIIDNVINGNRYAIGVTGQISLDGSRNNAGNVYSGNTIAGNLYQGSLVAEETIYGRLGLSYPAGYTSNVVVIRGNAYVPPSKLFTVAPGTIVKFGMEYGVGEIYVDGTFKAEGTPSNKIIFTSFKDDTYGGDSNFDSNATAPAPGNWRRIALYGATNDSSSLRNAIVRYGGNGWANIDLSNCRPLIDSCFVSYSGDAGIKLSGSATPTISNSEIHDNAYGISVNNPSNPLVRFCNFYRNSIYALLSWTTATIDAKSNYWGDPTGPFVDQGSDKNLTGKGNRIYIGSSGPVTYRPFYFARSGVLLGDVSNNGLISAYDAALVLRHSVGLDTLKGAALVAADVSGNGTVTAYDASLILQYTVGIISGFPGLGKTSGASLAEAFTLKLVPGANENEFTVVLHLNKATTVYSGDLRLTYNPEILQAVGVSKSALTKNFALEQHLINGAASLSLASAEPVKQEGDLVVISFRALKPLRGGVEASIGIDKFYLNEKDLKPLTENITVSVDRFKGIPETFGLEQNYPNPFNPTTSIEYRLPQSGAVTIIVYNLLGEVVQTLVNGNLEAGYHTAVWNGRNIFGQTVSSGLYIYRISVTANGKEAFAAVRKMMFLK